MTLVSVCLALLLSVPRLFRVETFLETNSTIYDHKATDWGKNDIYKVRYFLLLNFVWIFSIKTTTV